MKFIIRISAVTFALLFPFSMQALTNSSPLLSDAWQYTVMIKLDAKDNESGDIVPGFCNGTLVNPQVILTAAHCAVHASLLKRDTVHIEIGKYKHVTRPDGTTVRVGYAAHTKVQERASFAFLPSLERKMARSGFKTQIGPEEDVAIVFLQQPLALPADFVFGKVLPQAQLQPVLSKASSGILHVVTINLISVSTTDFKRIASLNNVTYRSSGFLESKSHSRVEPMDSGGGVFAKLGQDYYWLAAVKGRGETIWSNWDAYTIGVGRICQMARSARLPADSEKLLCL